MGNTTLEYLLEKNFESAKSVAKFGYNKVLNEKFGIECKAEFDAKDYLEFKYKLDQSICDI